MKAFSDLEQSKVLSKILPLDSADMYYEEVCNLPKVIVGNYILHNQCMEDKDYKKLSNPVLSPAWSLAALLDVLPVIIGDVLSENALRLRMDKSETDFNVWYENLDTGIVEEGFDIIETNPIDACVEMIIKLKEKNLI